MLICSKQLSKFCLQREFAKTGVCIGLSIRMKSYIEVSIVNTTECLGTVPFLHLLRVETEKKNM